MMVDRRGMELAVNTLVVLILGVVILGGGITLVYKIYDKAVELPSVVSQQQEQQLFSVLLSSNQRMVVLDNVRHVARKDAVTFPVAIQNQLEEESATFFVNASPRVVVPPLGVDCVTDECPVAFALPGPYELPRYESKAFYVVVDVPRKAKAGQYTFQTEVFTDAAMSPNALYARAKMEVIVE